MGASVNISTNTTLHIVILRLPFMFTVQLANALLQTLHTQLWAILQAKCNSHLALNLIKIYFRLNICTLPPPPPSLSFSLSLPLSLSPASLFPSLTSHCNVYLWLYDAVIRYLLVFILTLLSHTLSMRKTFEYSISSDCAHFCIFISGPPIRIIKILKI